MCVVLYMTKQLFKLTESPQSRSMICEAVLNAPSGDVVIIQEDKNTRSAAANSLYWAWLTDMEKSGHGNTKDDWHFDMKKLFLVRIYERDNIDYAAMIAAIRSVWKNGMRKEAEELHRHIVRETSTTDASVEQFSEYLCEISQYCSNHSIWLRTDDYLIDLAMGNNKAGN